MNRPKTPRNNKFKSELKKKFFNPKEKEATLLEVVEHLENIVSNINSKTNINELVQKLKDILLDIYKIINNTNKKPNAVENEAKEIIKDFNEIKKDIDDIKENKAEKKEEKKEENITIRIIILYVKLMTVILFQKQREIFFLKNIIKK